MELITDETRTKRLARVMMDNLGQYEEKLVKQGINEGTIFDLLDAHIEEAREEFNKRVAPVIAASKIFDYAIVDVLIKRAYKHKEPEKTGPQ